MRSCFMKGTKPVILRRTLNEEYLGEKYDMFKFLSCQIYYHCFYYLDNVIQQRFNSAI